MSYMRRFMKDCLPRSVTCLRFATYIKGTLAIRKLKGTTLRASELSSRKVIDTKLLDATNSFLSSWRVPREVKILCSYRDVVAIGPARLPPAGFIILTAARTTRRQ